MFIRSKKKSCPSAPRIVMFNIWTFCQIENFCNILAKIILRSQHNIILHVNEGYSYTDFFFSIGVWLNICRIAHQKLKYLLYQTTSRCCLVNWICLCNQLTMPSWKILLDQKLAMLRDLCPWHTGSTSFFLNSSLTLQCMYYYIIVCIPLFEGK